MYTKKLAATLVLSATILAACASTSKSGGESANADFQPRPVEEYKLDNGLRVLLVKDTSLPYITYELMLANGSAEDSSQLEGLSSLTASLIEKGTKTKSANVVAETFGQMAADLSESVGADYTTFRTSTLSKYQTELLQIFSEVLQEPVFTDKEIELLRGQFLSLAAKSSDNPSSFSDQLIDEYLFGQHPYGYNRLGKESTLKKIRRADILKHYNTYYRPNTAWLAVIGNYDGNIKKMIEASFGKWQSAPVPVQKLKLPGATDKLQVRIVDKPELVQTQIRFAQLGIPRNHPDFMKLRLANSILGSGFTSRLVNRVRDQLGLTYHISSNVDTFETTGVLEIRTFTKNETVGQAVSETLKTFKEFVDKGVTDSEARDAKSFMIGQFPQAVETAEAWVQNLLLLRRYGVPDTYLTEYVQNVSKISAADINDVIKKYYTPDKLKILAFSTSSKIEPQLRAVAPVEVRNFKEFQ